MRNPAEAFLEGLQLPKKAVDYLARDYARASGLPVADDATVGDMLSAGLGAQQGGRGGIGDMAVSGLTNVAMDPAIWASGAAGSTAARLVTPAERMVEISRWGRPGLESGDWVVRGGRGLGNYLRTGKWLGRTPASAGETFKVPAGALRSPQLGGPGNIRGILQNLFAGHYQYIP